MSGLFIFLGMLQLIGFFRAINLENSYYKFGKGNFWRLFSPLGFFLGLLICKQEIGNKIFYIIGAVLVIIFCLMILLIS